MTLPRELKLEQDEHGYLVSSVPVAELKKLRKERVKLEPGTQKRHDVGPVLEGGNPLFEIDLSSVELFVDHGALVLTDLCFPESGFQTISTYRSHESVNLKEGNIYTLKSIW